MQVYAGIERCIVMRGDETGGAPLIIDSLAFELTVK